MPEEDILKKYSTDLSVAFAKKLRSGGCITSVGSKGSGKSQTVLAVLRTCLENNFFRELHLVIPNFINEAADSYSWISDFNTSKCKIFIYNEYDTFIAERVCNFKGPGRIFLLLEDATSQNLFYIHSDYALKSSVINNRHIADGLTVWFCLHSLKGIMHPVLLDNMSFIFCHDVTSKKLLKDLFEMYFSVMYDWNDFINIYRAHAKRPFGAICLDLSKEKKIDCFPHDWIIIKKSLQKNLALQNKGSKEDKKK